ncbi:glucan 1,3-beta-glucosidase [Chaetomidium leptoderma]|uniref:Glucan 1,3-beta-glucosidase n=1 Tax=Chaetomidium leptoderma TaxID=669021 RepID=A0AAN6VMP5_9PEZI|nr:glucan 1,3-beta-glucosidase [Chaetomidium leptoderma]
MRTTLLWATTLLLTAVSSATQPPPDIQKRKSCQGPTAGNPQTWWRAQIGHNGTTPYAADSTFEYYRTAVQYGADSSGKEDSSDAFNAAIDAWNRTGNTVTTLPAYIYVPPGTYLIKKPIQMLVNTYLIGDPLDLPTLVADPALDSNPVILGYDDHQGEGSATKNFYMAVRNFKIDTTRIASSVGARAIEWSVSQGCSLTNIHVNMPRSSGHIGLTMDMGGSGKIISDCSFTGGAIGLQIANQQYMLKGLSFNGCGVGIFIVRSWVTTIQGCSFTDCNYGVDTATTNSTGTLSIVDSSVSRCTAGVNAYMSGDGQGSLVLDNFAVSDAVAVKSSSGSTLLQGSVPDGKVWVMGNTNPEGYQSGKTFPIHRPPALLVGGKYFTAPLPQYEKYDISQVVSVKEDPEHPVFGDNSHDDGPSINAILSKHANCKIVFFPQGIYRTNSTIFVPAGSRLVGEVFSTISGAGAHFSNPSAPQPILKLGNPGDRGTAQLSDLLISVSAPLPGAILVQINMASPGDGDATDPGSSVVGLWNCVLRVGGSADTLVTTQCGAPDPSTCKAAFALLHVTRSASAYLEDVWGWVADHGLDHKATDPPQNIAVGRGALIESGSGGAGGGGGGPTWLVGTSFEHCVLYQYALHGAANVYVGQHQTESPYWQGKGTPLRAPAPWDVDAAYGDPGFGNCEGDDVDDDNKDACHRAWAMHVSNTTDTVIHGSAMWSFYNGMNDGLYSDPQCTLTGGICQRNMAFVEGAKGMWWFSMSSKSAENLLVDAGTGEAGDGSMVVTSQRDNPGSWGAAVAAYLMNTGGSGGGGGGGGGDGNGDGGDEDSGGQRGSVSGLGLVVTVVGVLSAMIYVGWV